MLRDRSTTARKRTRFNDEDTSDENVNKLYEADESPEEAHSRRHIFHVAWDNVIGAITVRFSAASHIFETFRFLWNYQKMSREELRRKAAKLVEKYSKYISSDDHVQEMVHNANFGRKPLG